MSIKSNKLACIILIFISLNYFACSELVEKKKKINDIIAECGIEKQFSQLPEMLEQFLLLKKDSLNEDEYNKLNKIFKENFTSNDFIDSIRASFEKNYNDKYIAKIEKFYRTELAKKMTKVEVQNSTPEFVSKVSKIKINSLKKKRIQIIKEFLKVSKALEMTILIQESTFEGFVESYNRFIPLHNRISDETVKLIKDKMESNVYSKQNITMMIVWAYMTYEKVSDKELKEYMEFIDSEAGQWMNDVIIKGIMAGAKKCASKGV